MIQPSSFFLWPTPYMLHPPPLIHHPSLLIIQPPVGNQCQSLTQKKPVLPKSTAISPFYPAQTVFQILWGSRGHGSALYPVIFEIMFLFCNFTASYSLCLCPVATVPVCPPLVSYRGQDYLPGQVEPQRYRRLSPWQRSNSLANTGFLHRYNSNPIFNLFCFAF